MSLWTRCKALWQAVIHPTRVYTVYEHTADKLPQEVWDRIDKCFKQVDSSFKELEQIIDSLNKK